MVNNDLVSAMKSNVSKKSYDSKITYPPSPQIDEKGDYKDISLRFANLEWTDLQEAKNVTAWNLAGSNLRGAKLPKEVEFTLVDRVDQAAKEARTIYTVILVSLFISWLVRLSTSDMDVIKEGIAVKLPFIGEMVDIHYFYFLTPLLILVMHFYFQLIVQRILTGVINLPIFFPDGLRIDQKINSWPLLNVSEMVHRNLWEAASCYSKVRVYLTGFLFWLAVPLSLISIWVNYLEVHDFLMSLWHITVIFLCFLLDILFLYRTYHLIGNSYQFHKERVKTEVAKNFAKDKIKGLKSRRVGYGISLGMASLALTSVFTCVTLNVCLSEKNLPFKKLTSINMDHHTCVKCYFYSESTFGWDHPPLKSKGRNLRRMSAKNTNLQGSIFKDADLSFSNFTDARLDSANLERVNFTGAKITCANVKVATLTGAFRIVANDTILIDSQYLNLWDVEFDQSTIF